jgi:hypothetical protein
MDTVDPKARRSWLLLVMDHNPFYLLSGAFMLVGCYLLNIALYDKAGDTRKLLVLLGTINVYELLLVVLGLTLIRKRGFVRDGRILLGLEALFLVDITFTTGVISTINARWGMLVVAALLVLAAIKLKLILSSLKLPQSNRIWAFVLLELSAVLAGPALFKHIAMLHRGFLSASTVYLAWIIAGLIVVAGAGLWRREEKSELDREYGLGRFLVILPFLSLLVHLYSAAWVYSVPFTWAYGGPVMLGLAVVAGMGWLLNRSAALRLQAALVILGIWMSASFPSSIVLHFDGVLVSPLRLALAGGMVIVMVTLWRENRFLCLVVGSLGALAVVLGPSLPVMWANLVSASHLLMAWCIRITPRTTLEWGIWAVGAAFATLGAGAAMSYLKGVKDELSIQRSTSNAQP